ncbi:hypothetical protein HPP92_007246 [Vanilla planifolia]|uniref:Reverse transcriptase domain-containing protein n=1 Tax=Vanilla planifolia TaxID=51239 RepID=A0A835RQH9_VANPL|nr:hypothetical protein HPP92_007246 [Vanilla planifolia]
MDRSMHHISAVWCTPQWLSSSLGGGSAGALTRMLALALSVLVRDYETKQLLGFRPGQHAPLISHLLYSNDVLLFASATPEAARVVHKIMRDFSKATELP